MKKVYFDNAATTPVRKEVIETMIPYFNDFFGNPSSIHSFGRECRYALDRARFTVAKYIGAKDKEIIFTSGGTEGDNLAVKGIARANKAKGKHIITTGIEHNGVLNSFKTLEKEGFKTTYLNVDETGRISLDELKNSLREDTILVSIMYGNNEVGTIQPIQEIGEIIREHQAYFHTDAVQAFGVEKIDVNELGIDALTVASHKINGPKAVGFVYIKEGIKFDPILDGGHQEKGHRAGTENVPGIIGFAKAIEIVVEEREKNRDLYKQLREKFIALLEQNNIEFNINENKEYCLPHILNISFPGTKVDTMLTNLDLVGVAVSGGSACSAGSITPSHVLVEMFGEDSAKLHNSIRFSFGHFNTEYEVEYAVEHLIKIINRYTNK
jgi:cysteine desulfurase